MTKKLVTVLLILGVLAATLGCSAVGPNITKTADTTRTGSFRLHINWPTLHASQDEAGKPRIIPAGTEKMQISVEGLELTTPRVVNIDHLTSSVTIDNLPTGPKVATVVAQNASGNVMAQRKQSFVILAGQTIESSVPLGIAIKKTGSNFVLEPSSITVQNNDVLYFQNWTTSAATISGLGSNINLNAATVDSDGKWTYREETRTATDDYTATVTGGATCSITTQFYWTQMGSTITVNSYLPRLKLNNNIPYLFYPIDTPVYANLSKYNGSDWENVGSSGYVTAKNALAISCSFFNNFPYTIYNDSSTSQPSFMKYDSSWIGLGSFTTHQTNKLKCIADSNYLYVLFADTNIDGKATVMKYNGTTWQTVGNAGFSANNFTSFDICVDNNGILYTAFQHPTTMQTTVMTYDGTSWTNVDNMAEIGMNHSLSLATYNNELYIAYVDYNNHLDKITVKKFDGTNWINIGDPEFTENAAYSCSLCFDSAGTPYVAYDNYYASPEIGPCRIIVRKFAQNYWRSIGILDVQNQELRNPSLIIWNNCPMVAYHYYGFTRQVRVKYYQ